MDKTEGMTVEQQERAKKRLIKHKDKKEDEETKVEGRLIHPRSYVGMKKAGANLELQETLDERIDKLTQAVELIHNAVELIEEAVYETSIEHSAGGYIIPHLQNWADGNNPYDETIPKIIEELKAEALGKEE